MKSQISVGVLGAVVTVLFLFVLPAAHGAVSLVLDLKPDHDTLALKELNGEPCFAYVHAESCLPALGYPKLVPGWYRRHLLSR